MARDARKRTSSNFPQLPPAPDDYPTFPDTSTWPVVFPELPAAPYGGPCRPPQHTSKAAAPRIPADRLPNHVAIVMDGNGRWATQRGLARTEGHKMGEAVVIDIACGAIELGIKWLSLYAFSTENWKRSPEEVRFLMGFNRDVVRRRRDTLKKLGVRIRWVGSRPRLWRSVINELAVAEEMTKSNDVITINYEPVSRVSGTNEVSDGNETNNPAEVSDGNETNNPAEVSDGNETNNPAPVSRVSGTNEVSDGNETNNPAPVTEKPLHPHEPHIEILRGQPTDQELAALIAVLGSISGSTPPAQPEPTRWGLPVDQLRYPVFSWQRITLQEMTHMRR